MTLNLPPPHLPTSKQSPNGAADACPGGTVHRGLAMNNVSAPAQSCLAGRGEGGGSSEARGRCIIGCCTTSRGHFSVPAAGCRQKAANGLAGASPQAPLDGIMAAVAAGNNHRVSHTGAEVRTLSCGEDAGVKGGGLTQPEHNAEQSRVADFLTHSVQIHRLLQKARKGKASTLPPAPPCTPYSPRRAWKMAGLHRA